MMLHVAFLNLSGITLMLSQKFSRDHLQVRFDLCEATEKFLVPRLNFRAQRDVQRFGQALKSLPLLSHR